MESLSHIFSSFVKIHYKGEILFCVFGGEHLWEIVWLGSQKKIWRSVLSSLTFLAAEWIQVNGHISSEIIL